MTDDAIIRELGKFLENQEPVTTPRIIWLGTKAKKQWDKACEKYLKKQSLKQNNGESSKD